MKIYAISDLHLSTASPKPMDIYGGEWEGHWEKITKDWQERVQYDDIVLIAGDISWAMRFEEACQDLELIYSLKGHKVLIRGNHDYWWGSITRMRQALPKDMHLLQNDAVKISNTVFCGSRGWISPDAEGFSAEDRKIYDRELLRAEMSLKHAQKLATNGEKIIALTHFPPLIAGKNPSPLTELYDKYGVSCVVYGHIHNAPSNMYQPVTINSTTYYLTSCDYLKCSLLQLNH